jgi:hypothetical protein
VLAPVWVVALHPLKQFCIVRQLDGAAERCFEVVLERSPDQPGGIGVLHQATHGTDRPRNSDPDSRLPCRLGFDLEVERTNGGDGSVVTPRRGDSLARRELRRALEGDGFDFRSAEVDADVLPEPSS